MRRSQSDHGSPKLFEGSILTADATRICRISSGGAQRKIKGVAENQPLWLKYVAWFYGFLFASGPVRSLLASTHSGGWNFSFGLEFWNCKREWQAASREGCCGRGWPTFWCSSLRTNLRLLRNRNLFVEDTREKRKSILPMRGPCVVTQFKCV